MSQLLASLAERFTFQFEAVRVGQKTIEKKIMNWFADHTQPLKRMVYTFEAVKGSTQLRWSYWRFHGARDYLG